MPNYLPSAFPSPALAPRREEKQETSFSPSAGETQPPYQAAREMQALYLAAWLSSEPGPHAEAVLHASTPPPSSVGGCVHPGKAACSLITGLCSGGPVMAQVFLAGSTDFPGPGLSPRGAVKHLHSKPAHAGPGGSQHTAAHLYCIAGFCTRPWAGKPVHSHTLL